MKTVNPAYIEALKKVVKNSPYPRHMAMVLNHIELDRADVAIINPANKHVISVEAIWRTEIQEPFEKTGFPPSRE